MMNPKWEEIIVVAPRKEVFEDESLTFQGHSTDKELVDKVINNIDKNYWSMRRGNEKDPTPKENNAEINFDHLQPIPYIVIRRGDQFYATQRLEGAGEGRLHGKIAMGAGGHINPLSARMIESFQDVLLENTTRELDEELYIKGNCEINIVGLINDDSDDVNRVHVGILGFLELEEGGEVTVKETEQLAGKWCTLEQLRTPATYERLENWGKIVVDMM